MPTPLEVARAHDVAQRRLAIAAAQAASRMWRAVSAGAIRASWFEALPRLMLVVAGAQLAAARQSDTYADEVLAAQGLSPQAAAQVDATAFAGIASDGRDLQSLLFQPAVTALTGIARGAGVTRALASGSAALEMIVRTQVADAGRVADGVAIATRPGAGGYVRMMVGKTCSRCLILAGRLYRWNSGFSRHPRCDCRHIPTSEDRAGDLSTDPKRAFAAMTTAEQDRVFTKAGAAAIRDGADIAQVVNARRGAHGLSTAGRLESVKVFGQDVFVTTEGTTTRGIAGVRLGAREATNKADGDRYRSAKVPRLMPESIYRIADGDRDEAIRLLRRFGYIT